MSSTWRLHGGRALAIGLACAICLGTVWSPVAFAYGAGAGDPGTVEAEPGWPTSHLPENDPKPGDRGYALATPVAEPEEGMTDAELKAKDGAAFAQIVAERDVIERDLIEKVHARLKGAGIVPTSEGGTLSATDVSRAVTVLATTAYSPYGYLRFTLVRNTTSPYARNGYLGTLYFIYGIYSATTDSYRWYTVSWPAISGDNNPYHQSLIGVGPIPAYTWDFGFMYGAWRGYEADARVEFSPGKWRLDPWTGGPYGRAYLEVHGGVGAHQFTYTSGCVRLYPAAVTALRSYYTYKMANKYDKSSAHLYVRY